MTHMNRSEQANATLYEEYSKAWSVIDKKLPSGMGLSNPHFVRVPGHYFDSRLKVLVVGQETNGWGTGQDGELDEPLGTDPVKRLMQLYEDFDLGKDYMPSPFWQASHQLYHSINPNAPRGGFVWSNLVKIDQCGDRPDERYESLITDLRLLEMEVDTLEPDVVIFFTGPYYDDRLLATFPGANLEMATNDVFRVQFARPDAPLAWRTYHPGYLRPDAERWQKIAWIAERTREMLGNGT